MTSIIENLISQGNTFTFENNCQRSQYGTFSKASTDFQAWIAIVENFIVENYGRDSSPFRLYQKFNSSYINGHEKDDFEEQHSILIASLKSCKTILPNSQGIKATQENFLQNIFQKFHSIVIQLRKRHDNRQTLDIQDEYDVQDLLHCLLKLHFKDIRKEEWSPSYAGGSSRMDFLLKDEKTVIEVKKTRKGLDDKELGKQLIEDKAKYQVHPDCKKLICFTYDPEGRIVNPNGIQNDLNQKESSFKVEIIIMPAN